MTYPSDLFVVRDLERGETLRLKAKASALAFVQSLPPRLKGLRETFNRIAPGDDLEMQLDHFYRQNHILAGMAGLFGLARIDHLLQILDFALDLARHLQTVKVHSIDYLITLFYEKLETLASFEGGAEVVPPEVGDLVDEAGNYLTGPLKEWNLRIEAALSQPEPDLEPIYAPPSEPASEGASATESVPAPVAVQGPPVPEFDDGPEALNLPDDKVGMLSDFFEENSDILAQFANALVELESAGDSPTLVQDLFRMIHTFKGGARMMRIRKMESLSHVMESVLDRIRQGTAKATPEAVDLLLEGKDLLGEMLTEAAGRGPFLTRIGPTVAKIQALAAGMSAPAGAPAPRAEPTRTEVQSGAPHAEEGQPGNLPAVAEAPAARAPAAAPHHEKEKEKGGESLRISSEKLDEVLNTASEIFIGRIRFQNEVSAITQYLASSKAVIERATEMAPLLPQPNEGELTLQEELNLNHLMLDEIQKQLQKNVETLGRLSTRLQNGAMSFRMVPIASLLDRFPQQLRDLARTIGKKVKVQIVGGETELDKVLINRIADPLLHMLRNSIDHGIEDPETRLAAGKPEVGVITLETYYYGSHAVIEVRDDGRGIDLARVEAKAREKGLIPANRADPLTEPEILDLLFLPGFSTNDKVTELSGRGVGMDVVKTAIHQLQGTIESSTIAGQGSRFKLKLPLTLAIVKILLVQESSRQFALPILNIETLLTVSRSELQRIDGHLLYNLQGQTLPVTSLSTLLEFSPSSFADERIPLIILGENSRLVGVLVDSVIGRQEILIKSLGTLLKKVPFVMGCTILRDSKLVQILDPRQILDAVRASGSPALNDRQVGSGTRLRPSVLIVDDSSIQRENLRNILKRGDYQIEMAENGFDALKVCRNKVFSALFVDIVMPLMDGYELVERLRKVPAYATIPVFLISGRHVEQSRIAGLGISGVFQKPVDPDELLSALHQHTTVEEVPV
jgi:two-component system chemotaxis sensor kinase CheA